MIALDAMDSLPEKQRTVIHLFAVEELSLNEIGKILRVQPATAKVSLFHARQTLKRGLLGLPLKGARPLSEPAISETTP